MFKNASENVCTSAVVLSPDPLSPTPSIPSNMKTPENTDDPDDPQPTEEGDIQMENSFDKVHIPGIRVVTKYYL
jgi:hypothetical protein